MPFFAIFYNFSNILDVFCEDQYFHLRNCLKGVVTIISTFGHLMQYKGKSKTFSSRQDRKYSKVGLEVGL